MAKEKKKFELGKMAERQRRYLTDENGELIKGAHNGTYANGNLRLSAYGHRLMARGYFKDGQNETDKDKRALLFQLGNQENVIASTMKAAGYLKHGNNAAAAGEISDLNLSTIRQQTGKGFKDSKGNIVHHSKRYEEFRSGLPGYSETALGKGEDPRGSNYRSPGKKNEK